MIRPILWRVFQEKRAPGTNQPLVLTTESTELYQI